MRTPISVLAILGDAAPYGGVMDWIRRRGLIVNIVTSGADGLRAHGEAGADLVLLGLPLADMRAGGVIAGLHRQDPRAIVIVVGADPDIASQLQALELGAQEYVADPIDGRKDLLFALGVSLGMRKGDMQLRMLRAKDAASVEWKALVGNAPEMRQAIAKLRQVCERSTTRSIASVLISGELGTGKSFIARSIHYNGGRRNRAFVEVQCAGVDPDALHSQLFGHERGALPDARATRQGLFEVIAGGTLFLDEVSALSAAAQVEVLSAIEDRQIRRLGGTDPVHVDVQIIAATRRDLAAMVKRGELRADLYHRLNVVAVELPPLRERGDDIVALAESMIASLAVELGIRAPQLADDARTAMRGYRWPGNIRELRNELERIVLLVDDNLIRADHFRSLTAPVIVIDATDAALAVNVSGDRCPVEHIERELIRQALVKCGNISRAARYLDLTRQTLLYRMKKYGFASPSSPGFTADDPDP